MSRAFSVKFEDHSALLRKFARKGYVRALACGLPFEYEDVFQEMCLTYTKAREKWNPAAGVSFSAYLGQAVWNEWNKIVERAMRDPARQSIEQMSEDVGEADDNMSLLEVLHSENAPEPGDRLMTCQEVLVKIRSLSRLAKLVIAELLCNKGDSKITTRSVAERCGFGEQEIKQARKEMREKWGIAI